MRRRAFRTDVFMFYVTTLWALCALYAEWIESPIAEALPALWRYVRQGASGGKVEKSRK